MPYSRSPRGRRVTPKKPSGGWSNTPSGGNVSAWGMTEVEWWAVIVAVVAFVALVGWVEAWFGGWVADLIKEGMDSWDAF